MKRSTFNKIAKQSGLTFKQGLMLSLLISESKRTKKFEGKDRVPLGDLKWYDEKKINVLHSKGFGDYSGRRKRGAGRSRRLR